MALIEKRGANQWRARIRRKGQKEISRTFELRKDAEMWGRSMEREMDKGTFRVTEAAEKTTFQEAANRYKEEIFPRLARGGIGEVARLRRLVEHFGNLALAIINSSDVAFYRDQRLRENASPQTVKHELGLINRILRTCVVDWNITLPQGLPTADVRKPSMPPGRERRLSPEEESKLLEAADEYGGLIGSIIRFAIETAMRRGEIVKMLWENVDWQVPALFIPAGDTKTNNSRRIPLSTQAAAVLKSLPRAISGEVWDMKADSVTRAFERVCRRAGIDDLRFHDLRHEATSRLFEKGLDMIQVSSITGHKDLSMLKRYTHPRVEDLVNMLG